MNKQHHHHQQQEFGARLLPRRSKIDKFGEACVAASCHIILLIQNAMDGGYLSLRNPFVQYFLFSSALVLLSNEFSGLFENNQASSCITKAIHIMQMMAPLDPVADRQFSILNSFHEVVCRENTSSTQNSDHSPITQDSDSYLSNSLDPSSDPFVHNIPARSFASGSVALPHHHQQHYSSHEGLYTDTIDTSRQPADTPTIPNTPLILNSHHRDPRITHRLETLIRPQDNLGSSLGLSRSSSCTGDGSDSFIEDEMDFEMLWRNWGTLENDPVDSSKYIGLGHGLLVGNAAKYGWAIGHL